MSTEFFVDTNFRKASMQLVIKANFIIEEYVNDGYDLTLRQLYYQFVARGLIANKDSEYKRLGSVINKARLAGLIDWDTIKDRTRAMEENLHWDDPSEPIRNAARHYKIDTREDQPEYVEVWVEKEALAGVVERACRSVDVPWFACRGYVSQTAMYEAGNRFRDAVDSDKRLTIIHLGDHDPSGIDMTRDIADRMEMFCGCDIEVNRIALTMDQVDEYSPPPNPAKLTDSRCGGYMAKYGDESWELDALDPKTITRLIEDAVEDLTDEDLRDVLIDRQRVERNQLKSVARNWKDVVKLVKGK